MIAAVITLAVAVPVSAVFMYIDYQNYKSSKREMHHRGK